MAVNRSEWEIRSLASSGDEPQFELSPIAPHFAVASDPARLWELADEITRLTTEFQERESARREEP